MARVALIKLFTGLNLGVSQLSGDLRRAGHETQIIYLKDFLSVPVEDAHRYQVTEYALTNVAARAREYIWNCYKPFTEREYELLIDTLRAFKPDLVGLGLTSLTMLPAEAVTARIKQHFDVPVIWGGPGPTVEPDRGIRHADMVCVGEGEELILELAARLDRGADYADIPGLWLRRDGQVVKNPQSAYLELDDIAVPDFEPARFVHINDDTIRHNVYPLFRRTDYPIMTQRGCPFSCNFCIESVYQDMFGKKQSLRRRKVDTVIEELVQAKRKYGIRYVMFFDDVFTVNPRWLREFAPVYKREVGLPFWCYTYPTTTRVEDLLLLKDAGLKSITMGIQSGSEEILQQFHRPVAKQKAMEAAKLIVDCGINCFFDLITRVHYETEEHCRQTFEFLLEFPREMQTVGFGGMVSFPNFGYTEKVKSEERKIVLSDDVYRYYHRLYLLTRTKLPRWLVRALGQSRIVRHNPSLIDRLLPDKLPFFHLGDESEFAEHILDLPHAQAVIPGREAAGSLAAGTAH
jgi:anaerobic magnesium-protoporphyrin IX monomethyl ester cyclase